MRTYQLIAPAKVNLLLEVIGSRPDGYHELVMVLQSIDLADELLLRPLAGHQVRLVCDHPQVPQDQSNLAVKAAKLMQSTFPDQASGVEIQLRKQIPIGAGLAGGSTDAAAVLVGLDLMWNLGLTQDELHPLAAKLGSDVPFCISGGTALALGRGEELSPLPDLDRLYAVLAKYRSLAVSTPWAYQTYRQQFQATYAQTAAEQDERRRNGPSVPLLSAIAHRDPVQIGQALHNDLEKVVLPEQSAVAHLRETLAQMPVLGTMMSGSGPTVFALTETREAAQQVATALQLEIPDPDLEVWVTKFIPSGIQIADLAL